jgi:hypothetical protein
MKRNGLIMYTSNDMLGKEKYPGNLINPIRNLWVYIDIYMEIYTYKEQSDRSGLLVVFKIRKVAKSFKF